MKFIDADELKKYIGDYALNNSDTVDVKHLERMIEIVDTLPVYNAINVHHRKIVSMGLVYETDAEIIDYVKSETIKELADYISAFTEFMTSYRREIDSLEIEGTLMLCTKGKYEEDDDRE